MLQRLYAVRHGEVDNPGEVVYSDLPGFHLSEAGLAQAQAAADHLAGSGAALVVSSPLDRAVETATFIAGALGAPLEIDERLTEWRLSERWAGVRWDALTSRFPGELEQYLADPWELRVGPERLAEVEQRMLALVASLDDRGDASAVVVSHQDPVQALRIGLPGADRSGFTTGKPDHASVITLERVGGEWAETAAWTPEIPSVAFPPPGERQ